MEDRFSLLIDAENISAKYIKPILNELSRYGKVTYKRVYGDWTSANSANWKDEILDYSITPIQQFRYVQGKNASDSAMIIDAMDMLYTGNVEGFCLVSSDSDFTRLAGRLREGGMKVIGMGEKKTPQALRGACDIFTLLETLLETEDDSAAAMADHDDEDRKDTSIVDKSIIERDVIEIIRDNDDKNKKTGLGEVGSRLVKLYPEFDVRRYGYSMLSKFLETFDKLSLVTENNKHVFVEIKTNQWENDKVIDFIVSTVQRAGSHGIGLGPLGTTIHEECEGFDVKDYGYTQFSKFVESLDGIQLKKNNSQITAKYKK